MFSASVLNGFAHHEHPVRALAIPIAPIPTGSGNGLSLNLLGLEAGSDVAEAALNVVKGTDSSPLLSLLKLITCPFRDSYESRPILFRTE